MITIQTDSCRYAIGTNGQNLAFVDLATGKDYCEPAQASMMVGRGKDSWPSSAVALDGDALLVTFGASGIKARVKVESHPRYFTLSLVQVTGGEPDWMQFVNLRLKITESVGTLLNAGWNSEFAACALACNDRTESYGASGAYAHLCVRAHAKYGFEGANVAVLGVPRPALLDAIEQVELGEGLPHLMLNGVWIHRAPERFASYLMVHGLGESNADQVIELAKGGFGCVEFYPWRDTPTYRFNPGLFPNGLDGLKQVCDKIHAARLQVGLHCMQSMVGWGDKTDPAITPKADPRLLQDQHGTLAAAVDAQATEMNLKEGTEGWPDTGDLFVDGEIVRYAKKTPTGFAECQRGVFGTTVAPRPAGTRVGYLVNCFPIWGYTIYCPDVETGFVDEISERLAGLFDATGTDMSYFDGGEELCKQPPHWRNVGRVALGVQTRVKKPVILEGNALYTNLSWHVVTRGSPHYDPIYFGRREYTLRFKGQQPANHAKNLLTGDVGWFTPHVHSLTTDAVTPDEVMLLCLKAVGHQAPISFTMNAANPWDNRRMPEMLDIIRTCDYLKRVGYFSDAVRTELTKPMAEHVLEQATNGAWQVRPMAFGPSKVVNATRPELAEWHFQNPHGDQAPWLRIRAQPQLAPYGAKENIVLADFAAAVPFKPERTASPDLTQSVDPSSEKTPDGAAAFCYRAENKGKAASEWTELVLSYPAPQRLTTHRRLGVWVRAEGKGGILNFQLAGTNTQHPRRDHYIQLDFTGWRYVVLDPPEDSRFWNYKWPYSWTDLFYTCQSIYNETNELRLYYNGLPPGTTTCWIGRIEALAAQALPLQSPALEVQGQKVVFPVAIQPDEYIEVDWSGAARLFERDGGLIRHVSPEGGIQFRQGDNVVRLLCAGGTAASTRAEVTLATRGEPLPNQPPQSSSGASPETKPGPAQLRLAPTPKGGFRLTEGPYELVGREPPHQVATFDGTANTWTVDNDTQTPIRAAIVVQRGAGGPDVDYDTAGAVSLETFDDLSGYDVSETNQFEKYATGGGKRLTKDGPVQDGVSQTFVSSADAPRAGANCGVYTARNEGASGGWGAKGRRFPKPLDLSGYAAVAFWLHGDGNGESLRFQFWDVAGRYADWVVPISFTGWRLQVFATSDAKNFDWKQVEYVLFYYNNLPANTTCTLKFDDLKALPALRTPPVLARPTLLVNGSRFDLPVDLGPGAALLLDSRGHCSVWQPGGSTGSEVTLQGLPFTLKPGPNRIELACDTSKPAPRDVTVRILPLGPAGPR
ncbi:MAG: hypothetical protein A3K19_13950 [Lentisphaerae bacterium RIFOXYB12_FULL_65_16]|nr:MAG: hypothetical protein A3K18_25950 [Lentisphaerae bacterium RIFOXYA12_64_32]OGV88217.1 MAG: hypothetical protein A3K19_13950 [Lentisphaerae bacterium RIFOXYB12_FULL_65_16]